MFRKPREQPVVGAIPPSVGRAPTPPPPSTTKIMSAVATKKKPAQSQLSSFFNKAKGPQGQQNDSILKFFQKVSSPAHHERNLFVGNETKTIPRDSTPESLDILESRAFDGEERRFNEYGFPQKRRCLIPPSIAKISELGDHDSRRLHEPGLEEQEQTLPDADEQACFGRERIQSGPFAEDSGSEAEQERDIPKQGQSFTESLARDDDTPVVSEAPIHEAPPYGPVKPTLTREATSFIEDVDFDKFEDFDGEEFYEGGEEYLERKYMEEQAALEKDFEEDDLDVEEATELAAKADASITAEEAEAACPICSIALNGVSSQDASVHVNNCLDGKPSPLPTKTLESPGPPTGPSAKRFQRSAIPRPGQADPFSLTPSTNGSSAFSRLMSSHAEDEAWAAAAANEIAARGKPAFKRTCPFYKILPGFFICVDAFRFGAVEGCNAYFLSHFHSDHYIGLTASWCHGPIYCSKVTGNLVRQQLRVDPKWVVDLNWDEKVEVPNTQGVYVTMIPANHCPGSSLYLFEKAMSKGSDPRLQRVLHCGDFRACTAHVQYPLLRPDVLDAVTGKKRQQKINVCYLDTTYLTPKYAFPPQEKVIQACVDMCVSLSKDKVDQFDAWERTKKARAGSGMVKFVEKGLDQVKKEDADDTTPQDRKEDKGRGRLLVVVGTYSIGKERMCMGIARALGSKIYAPPSKKRICLALEDPELTERLTDNPYEAQVHMQMLMEIRPETLADYLTEYKPRFSRVVGFRPTGWNYRPPNSRFVESPLVQTVLHSDNWKTNYSMAELMPQRGSTRESNCFGVPYSEHSSFRELTMFCCALRIDKIIPTVNIGSAKSREKMKGWIEKWAMEKKKNGLFKVADGATSWS